MGLKVYIVTPPTVNITSPSDGAIYTASATIILSADASDADGTIKTVDFYNGNKLIFTEKQAPFYRRTAAFYKDARTLLGCTLLATQ